MDLLHKALQDLGMFYHQVVHHLIQVLVAELEPLMVLLLSPTPLQELCIDHQGGPLEAYSLIPVGKWVL